jgi:hypothetical protein
MFLLIFGKIAKIPTDGIAAPAFYMAVLLSGITFLQALPTPPIPL